MAFFASAAPAGTITSRNGSAMATPAARRKLRRSSRGKGIIVSPFYFTEGISFIEYISTKSCVAVLWESIYSNSSLLQPLCDVMPSMWQTYISLRTCDTGCWCALLGERRCAIRLAHEERNSGCLDHAGVRNARDRKRFRAIRPAADSGMSWLVAIVRPGRCANNRSRFPAPAQTGIGDATDRRRQADAAVGRRITQLQRLEPGVYARRLAEAEGPSSQHGAGDRLLGTGRAAGGEVRFYADRRAGRFGPTERPAPGLPLVRHMSEHVVH